MVSLKDIAAECGVSIATVSKALNDHSDIGVETKNRIRKKANEMGYVPNAAAKSMKTNRTHNIGVLFMDDANSGLQHDFFAGVLESFKKAVEKEGYDITFISNDRTRPGRSSYLNHARYRRFDGVIIANVHFDDPEVIELVNSDIPVVTINHIYNDTTAILSDDVDGMTALVDFAIKNGHRKIAYIHGADSSVTKSRLITFNQKMEEYGIDIPEGYVEESPYRDMHGAYETTLKLLEREDIPTCILYPDDYASYGGIRAINEKGLKVPEDISIIGYDGIRVARHIRPRLTTYRQNTDEMGTQAARNLIDLIERPNTTLIKQVVIKGNLLEGDTLKKLD
ncbi:LacI family DNA-binding transcriptional regulator [Pseudobutyrivibrio sp.]|uniref:LacI family DNA-binding transcriptional regulator n=1 Tax=Pseudobutyrivibrio sp. TaxID=2014367 RepID=UPI001DDB73B6|nr:LacI family DNA-binding transcriptional regulator [Pseudobutyrivibrio sp.]MBE5910582.1 LacI family transcriptional regulator [Pseudobutyrivibrio sp.]